MRRLFALFFLFSMPELGCRYRLLCAEREDKVGDKWRKETQLGREQIFARKRNEAHQSSAPPRQQQRVASEATSKK